MKRWVRRVRPRATGPTPSPAAVPGSGGADRQAERAELTRARRLDARGPSNTHLPRDALEDLGVDVEVRVHRVDVVIVLERLDQPHQPGRAVLVERDARLRLLGDLGGLDLDPGL